MSECPDVGGVALPRHQAPRVFFSFRRVFLLRFASAFTSAASWAM